MNSEEFEAYKVRCRERAKGQYKAWRLAGEPLFLVNSHNDKGAYHLVHVNVKTLDADNCSGCKGFQAYGYCVHTGAAYNSVQWRVAEKKRKKAKETKGEVA